MREILFRGKTFITKKMVTGTGILYDGTNTWIVNNEPPQAIAFGTEYHTVIPETIGQYTGLTDKNGKKIFEGDIVKCTDKFSDYEFIAVVMFGNPNGEYNWGFQLNRISGANANTDILLWVEMEETGAFIEVIGNIHDNPELLKECNR